MTLTWQSSPSSDVISYRVRSSGGEDRLDCGHVPLQDSPDLSYEQTFTDETGLWLSSVRAVDADGNEDCNIRQVVAIPFQDGAPVAFAAEPRLVEARVIE